MKRQHIVLILTGLLILVRGGSAMAQNLNPGIIPPNAHAYGMTYGEWSAEWWKWAISIPVSEHPLFDNGDCDTGQIGKVWFLGGSFAGTTTVRECTVPSGRAIFFPVVNVECSTVEPPPFHGENEAELRECAKGFMDGASATLSATIDGRSVQNIASYRVQSPLFTFSAPADNVLFIPGPVKGQSVSDGYWLLLAPLSRGEHEIHFEGNPGFPINVTYILTIN
jgi:hypothetical protein